MKAQRDSKVKYSSSGTEVTPDKMVNPKHTRVHQSFYSQVIDVVTLAMMLCAL